MLLIRYDKQCVGLRLWRWGRFQCELWYCPRGYRIVEHSHPNVDIELVLLFGRAMFARRKRVGDKPERFYARFPRHFLRRFTVKAGMLHWFEVSNCPLLFVNIERWKVAPTSAATDFLIPATKENDYAIERTT